MNEFNYSWVRCEFMFRFGKNIDQWHKLVGVFVEETNFGKAPYTKTIKASPSSRYRSMTITYHPEDGWSCELKE